MIASLSRFPCCDQLPSKPLHQLAQPPSWDARYVYPCPQSHYNNKYANNTVALTSFLQSLSHQAIQLLSHPTSTFR
jgi:hypothetical protein